MVLRKTKNKGVQISKIVGEELPMEPDKNGNTSYYWIWKDLDNLLGSENTKIGTRATDH